MNIDRLVRDAQKLEKIQKLDQAAGLYGRILAKYPQNPRAKKGLAKIERQTGGLFNALEAEVMRLSSVFRAGRHQECLEGVGRAIGEHPKSRRLRVIQGHAQLKLQNIPEAQRSFQDALNIDPDFVQALLPLADLCAAGGDTQAAIELYRRVTSIDSQNVHAWNNLGNALTRTGSIAEAESALKQAHSLVPGDTRVALNLGGALLAGRKLEEAKAALSFALQGQSEAPRALSNLGQIEYIQGNLPGAVAYFAQAVDAAPEDQSLCSSLAHYAASINDWDVLPPQQQFHPGPHPKGKVSAPFHVLARMDEPMSQLMFSKRYSAANFPKIARPTFEQPSQRPEKLRIGYFSSDICRHATMQLIGGLFEQHDKSRFEIFVYSYGTPDDGPEFLRASQNVHTFRDISEQCDSDIVQQVRRDCIDIAVDLKGHTQDSRSRLFGYYLAPLQVAWLGYPGSMGHPCYDYAIVDRVTVPEEWEESFTEHLIFMPDTYQINDDRIEASASVQTRADHGLPEDGFVFCSFNNSYKIGPEEFDIWMRLLKATDCSVLWLLKSNEWSVANLRREADARGVDPDRLIFAERCSLKDHLARHQLADLFLDTFNCNAHTTASDALRMGLPIMSCAGKQFAARVCASLLHAAGMPELVATSRAEYEAMALRYASDPEALAALKGRLEKQLASSALFDTARFTRNLETAFDRCFEQLVSGQGASNISL